MTTTNKMEPTNEDILHVAKDAYLHFKDHYDKFCYWSYPLWDKLSEKEKNWWCSYVKEIYTRYTIIKKSLN